MKKHFLLDPDIIFLNHGSFGATPHSVFEAYQEWQRRLERQPVHFIMHELWDHLAYAREKLGDFVGANPNDLVFIPNSTFGLNVVARSFQIEPDSEVLTTNHEYGACDNVWHFLSRKQGFRYVQQPITLPVVSPEAIVEQLWQGVTPHTKYIFLSHITSATSLCLPIAEICRRAREERILTIVDGAHAPGQIPLDLKRLDPDFYFGNTHKWLCSPKGSAFLYVRADKQPLIEPLVIGWGWGENRSLSFGSDFLDYMQWLGTNDLAAYLSVPAAIKFQREHDWTAVRHQCHELLSQAMHAICTLTRLPPLYPESTGFYHQMATVPLPHLVDTEAFKVHLYNVYKIEVPIVTWHGRHFIRVSVQGYNSQSDIDTLIEALTECLPEFVA